MKNKISSMAIKSFKAVSNARIAKALNRLDGGMLIKLFVLGVFIFSFIMLNALDVDYENPFILPVRIFISLLMAFCAICFGANLGCKNES